jgi:SAM-dependent methyltransferase
MNQTTCPLCCGRSLTSRESITSGHLARIYQEQLGVEVSGMFASLPLIEYLACDECGLHFFHPPVIGSDAFYRQLMERFDWYYADDKWEFRTAAELVQPGDSVLEVGCGRGHFATKIACGRYVGLETSAAAIERTVDDRNALFNETIEKHSEKYTAAYDLVCSFQVVEHVADPGKFIKACVRALKPGGLLILSTPSMESFVDMLVNDSLNLPPHHLSRWPERTWRSLERLFPLVLERMDYEPLQEVHYRHYSRGVAVALARELVGAASGRVTDLSPEHEAALAMAEKFSDAALKVLADQRLRPARGHTVLAVYRRIR